MVALGLLLSACPVPRVYGTYYHPTYPEASRNVWITGPEGGPLDELRIGGNRCYMEISAKVEEENYILEWNLYSWRNVCRFKFHPQPLILEDLDTDSNWKFDIFYRALLFGPGLDIKQTVDLVSLLPGFATVQSSERRYALSILLERRLNGPLPETTRIQLPDILLEVGF